MVSVGRTRNFDLDQALDSAVETFWQHGFDATSVQHLCRAMDIQPGSVYAAFGSKRDLFLAAVRRYTETVAGDALARIDSAHSALQGLRAYFAHLVDTMVDGRRRWGCLITNSVTELAPRDAELADLFAAHLTRLRTVFAAVLARAAEEGELRPGAGPEAAGLLVAVVQGMNVLAKTQPGRAALQAVADSAIAGIAR
jgi:TetR/AcrR family transcriptional repressor of nem operon